MKLTVWITLIVIILSLGALTHAQENVLYRQDFGGDLTGWRLNPGWTVTPEGTLHGEGHTWATYEGQDFGTDWRITFRLELVRGRVHLNYRLNDQGRYFIGFEEGRSDIHKQMWPDTFSGELTVARLPHTLNTWHTVEIVGEGPVIHLVVDGQLEWEYVDPDPLLNGTFAFETIEESEVVIDDIVVYGAGTAAAPPPSEPPPSEPPPAEPALPDTASVSGQPGVWIRTGGPLGGLGYDIRVRPDNPDVMLVTDAWAGVFKSTDGGRTWSPSNNGIETRVGETGDAIPIFCLTIDPHDYDTIWAGTQNTRGIYKSIDGGDSWVQMDNGVVESEGITFRGFTVDPNDENTVYAAAELSSWVWAGREMQGREFDRTAGVVYRTRDGGQNWSAIWRGNNLARYVWIDPRDSNVIYISTGIFDREAANSDPQQRIPGGEGVVKSIDGGQTWFAANNGLDNLYVGSLFMHPTNPDILLAGTGNNQYYDHNGVYLTTDGAQTWRQVLRDANINAVEFSISDPTVAYAGSADAIFISMDTGQTWRKVSGLDEYGWGPPGVRAGFPIDFQVDPREAGRLFANNYGGGNFVSNDGGKTWEVASAGYTGAQVRDIAASPDQVFAAARSGLFASADGGASWQGLSFRPASALEWNAVAVDPTSPQHVLASNNWNGILLQSFDAGQSWQPVGSSAGEGRGWRVIAFAPSDPQTAYAGLSAYYSAGSFNEDMPSGGVSVTHDGGSHWQPANGGAMADANVTALAVVWDNPAVVYAATGNHGILKSTDGGATWISVSTEEPMLSVAVSPQDANRVLIGRQFGGMRSSTDGGVSWSLVTAGMLPEANLSDIVFDPANPMLVYASDRMSGVYRSTDGGVSWQAINQGLQMRTVNALALTPDSAHLYAATEGGGVYRYDME
jgi:photosystem II stability/assembly factor-like uncharacterized protein